MTNTAVGTLAAELLSRVPDRPVQIVPIKVVATSPLRVNVNNDFSVSVPARALGAQVFDAGFVGLALWQPPQQPVVFTIDDDTGWVNLTYEAGYSAGTPGQLAYRRVGQTVFLRGGATRSGDFPNDGTLRTAAMLPSGTRPGGEHLRISTFGTSLRPAALEVRTNGDILMGVRSSETGTVSWISASCTYLTD